MRAGPPSRIHMYVLCGRCDEQQSKEEEEEARKKQEKPTRRKGGVKGGQGGRGKRGAGVCRCRHVSNVQKQNLSHLRGFIHRVSPSRSGFHQAKALSLPLPVSR